MLALPSHGSILEQWSRGRKALKDRRRVEVLWLESRRDVVEHRPLAALETGYHSIDKRLLSRVQRLEKGRGDRRRRALRKCG